MCHVHVFFSMICLLIKLFVLLLFQINRRLDYTYKNVLSLKIDQDYQEKLQSRVRQSFVYQKTFTESVLTNFDLPPNTEFQYSQLINELLNYKSFVEPQNTSELLCANLEKNYLPISNKSSCQTNINYEINDINQLEQDNTHNFQK